MFLLHCYLIILFSNKIHSIEGDVKKCEKNWLNYRNEKCVKILNDRKFNYSEAVIECERFDSSLLKIKTIDENLFIASHLYPRNDDKLLSKGLFIGLKRNQVNDEFHWDDSSPLNYQNWAPDEPTPWGEDCVEIYSIEVNAGQWNDILCHWKRFAICERVIDKETEFGVEFKKCLDSEYFRYRDSCYKIYENELGWNEANDQCNRDSINGSLLWIENSYEHSFIQFWTRNSMKSIEFWIGLHSTNLSLQPQYEWTNQWPVYYTSWSGSERDIRPETGHQCVIQDRDSGLWRNNPFCDDKRAFVCKTSDQPIPGDETYANAVCPLSLNRTDTDRDNFWVNLHKRSKYCYWFSEKLLMDWTAASKYCRSRDGTLATIHNKVESEMLKPLIRKYGQRVWIGLYQSPSGQFRWEDGSAVDYTDWFPGEPTDEETEFCVEMRAEDLSWNDVKCKDYNLRFICEIEKLIINDNNASDITTEAEIDDQMPKITTESLSKWFTILIIFLVILLFLSPFICFCYCFKRDKNFADNCFCLKSLFSGNNPTDSSGAENQTDIIDYMSD